MSRPTIPDERAPFNTDARLTAYLTRMFRYCKIGLNHLHDWTVKHIADPDPHPQYALETEALATFTLSAYGGILADGTEAMPDLGAGWTLFTAWNSNSQAMPRFIVQDFLNNGIRFEREGVYSLNLKISLQHAEAQGGRVIYVRFLLDGVPTPTTFAFGVGRNTEYTNLIIPSKLVPVSDTSINGLLQIEVGGGSTFTGVSSIGGFLDVFGVSEAQGLESASATTSNRGFDEGFSNGFA